MEMNFFDYLLIALVLSTTLASAQFGYDDPSIPFLEDSVIITSTDVVSGVSSVSSGDIYVDVSPTTGDTVVSLTTDATQWLYNQTIPSTPFEWDPNLAWKNESNNFTVGQRINGNLTFDNDKSAIAWQPDVYIEWDQGVPDLLKIVSGQINLVGQTLNLGTITSTTTSLTFLASGANAILSWDPSGTIDFWNFGGNNLFVSQGARLYFNHPNFVGDTNYIEQLGSVSSTNAHYVGSTFAFDSAVNITGDLRVTGNNTNVQNFTIMEEFNGAREQICFDGARVGSVDKYFEFGDIVMTSAIGFKTTSRGSFKGLSVAQSTTLVSPVAEIQIRVNGAEVQDIPISASAGSQSEKYDRGIYTFNNGDILGLYYNYTSGAINTDLQGCVEIQYDQ